MAGAPCYHSAPESRRPRSRADPQATTACSPAHSTPPRNASLDAAPLVSPLHTQFAAASDARTAGGTRVRLHAQRRLRVAPGCCLTRFSRPEPRVEARQRQHGPPTTSTGTGVPSARRHGRGSRAIFGRPGVIGDVGEMRPTECRVAGEAIGPVQPTASQTFSVVRLLEDQLPNSAAPRSLVGTSRVLPVVVTAEWGRGRIQRAPSPSAGAKGETA